jgi:Abi-like protein.
VTPAELTILEQRLSAERLAPYRTMTGDLGRAINLYRWNAEAAAAFWATLGHIEILLRNAMHDELTAWATARHGQPLWYLDPGQLLTIEAHRDIDAARRRATRAGNPETPGRAVAELSLGFWRFLLASRYERTLWRTCLHRAFPGQGLRRAVHNAVADLHVLRNRIAHHEPVHNRPLVDLHATALTVADWVCPTSRSWINKHCKVWQVLSARP